MQSLGRRWQTSILLPLSPHGEMSSAYIILRLVVKICVQTMVLEQPLWWMTHAEKVLFVTSLLFPLVRDSRGLGKPLFVENQPKYAIG